MTSVLIFAAGAVGGNAGPDEAILRAGSFDARDPVLGKPGSNCPWEIFIHGESDAAVAVAEAGGRNGSRCLRYDKSDLGSQNIHVDQIIEVKPDTIYRISAWSRGDDILTPMLSVTTLEWKVLASTPLPCSDRWEEAGLFVHSHAHTRLRLEWFPGATGKLCTGVAGSSRLDDVAVLEITDPDPALTDAFELTRPRKQAELDVNAIQTGAVGSPEPLRPIVCRNGALVYADDNAEVALFGVNFQTALSWEYNARMKNCGLTLKIEVLKDITDRNLDEVQQMGLDCLRLHLLPSDFSGPDGSVRDSIFLDVLDYLLAQCRKRGIYVYLTLMNEMNSRYMKNAFLNGHEREHWITDPELIRLSEKYVREFLTRKNRYTEAAYRVDPVIAVIEISNEPGYVDYAEMNSSAEFNYLKKRFSEWCDEHNLEGKSRVLYHRFRYEYVRDYIDRMSAAIRATGCRKPVAWNLNWPRMINNHEDVFQAVADSVVDVVSFCLYPGQGDIPHPFWKHPRDLSAKNYLPFLDRNWREYERLRWALGERFAHKARAVYEFETFYNQTGYMYPAMAALFRALGVQIANMWTYTLTPTAEFFSGSHYLNLYCTPRKAASFIIANELFSRIPRYTPYDPGKQEKEAVFPNCAASFEQDISVLSTEHTLMHSRTVDWNPLGTGPNVRRIIGVGSSPLVNYEGSGIYWITVAPDRIDITINPDAKFVRAPWDRQRTVPRNRVCALDTTRGHPMTLNIAGWDRTARVIRLERESEHSVPLLPDEKLTFKARPGHYRLKR